MGERRNAVACCSRAIVCVLPSARAGIQDVIAARHHNSRRATRPIPEWRACLPVCCCSSTASAMCCTLHAAFVTTAKNTADSTQSRRKRGIEHCVCKQSSGLSALQRLCVCPRSSQPPTILTQCTLASALFARSPHPHALCTAARLLHEEIPASRLPVSSAPRHRCT
jgi:hypothetical protein